MKNKFEQATYTDAGTYAIEDAPDVELFPLSSAPGAVHGAGRPEAGAYFVIRNRVGHPQLESTRIPFEEISAEAEKALSLIEEAERLRDKDRDEEADEEYKKALGVIEVLDSIAALKGRYWQSYLYERMEAIKLAEKAALAKAQGD